MNFQDDNEKFLIQMIQQGFDEGRIKELFPLLPGTKNGEILKSWDYIYGSKSKGASLFESVYRELIAVVFGDSGLGREVITFMEESSLLLLVFTSRMDEILLSDNSSWFGEQDRDGVYKKLE